MHQQAAGHPPHPIDLRPKDLQKQKGNQSRIQLDQDGISRPAEEVLDLQVPLDPAEEQFNRPPMTIDLTDHPRRQIPSVGQKGEELAVWSLIDHQAEEDAYSGSWPSQTD